jgi:hypothetical protein
MSAGNNSKGEKMEDILFKALRIMTMAQIEDLSAELTEDEDRKMWDMVKVQEILEMR